jgi:hypothetical protein
VLPPYGGVQRTDGSCGADDDCSYQLVETHLEMERASVPYLALPVVGFPPCPGLILGYVIRDLRRNDWP